MKIQRATICRGEGHGYIQPDIGANASLMLTARAETQNGTPVPCQVLHRSASDTERDSWLPVVVVPLLASDLTISLLDGQEVIWDGVFPQLQSKIQSRLLTKRDPDLAQRLRGIETPQNPNRAHVNIIDIWPADDGLNAWRVSASFPTDKASACPRVSALDHQGVPLPCRVITLEDHVVPGASSCGSLRLVTFSVLLAQEIRHACISVDLEGEDRCQSFRCLLPFQVEDLLARSRARIGGASEDPAYHRWFLSQRAGLAETNAQRNKAEQLPDDAPFFSILTPGGTATQTIRSLEAQTYPRWEGINRLADAKGSHVVLLGVGGTLEPDALWSFFEYFAEHPQTDLLYADEDAIDDTRYIAPVFKPEPNYDKLLSHYYVGYPLVVGHTALDQIPQLEDDSTGICAYEISLKAFELDLHIAHLPRILYHASPCQMLPQGEAERRTVARHLERRGILAIVEDGPCPHTNRIRYELPDPAPHVSIVIPTKDHVDLLRTCVTSILDRTIYSSYDIVVVENNSVEAETFAYYDEISCIPCVKVVTWKPTAHAENGFNYSAIVNYGAHNSEGELIVFLNNDTEVIASDWLSSMAGLFVRPEVGLVGAKLLFGDGLIQHAGLSANPNCDFLHPNQNLSANEPGYLYSAVVTSDMPMVTGACQMIRRSLFDDLGGYDEQLAVGFNDGDFCLRVLESGHLVVFSPDALLHHREFSTRGREAADSRLQARYLREKAYLMARHSTFLATGDPTVNPNLDRFSPWRELRRL